MQGQAPSDFLAASDVADVLEKLAQLMAAFHKSDVALQDALSSLTRGPENAPNMFELQHVDLLTQAHNDLAKMLPVLAESLRDTTTARDKLINTLTLRSLQDSLIHSPEEVEPEDIEAGELSLF